MSPPDVRERRRDGDPTASSHHDHGSRPRRSDHTSRRRRSSRAVGDWRELLANLARAQQHHRHLSNAAYAGLVRQEGARWQQAIVEAHQRRQERRARVLKYPDLAEEICGVLGLSAASHWNGYVPPASDPEGRHGVRPNTSPIRVSLVEICTEALRREQAEKVQVAT